MFTRTITFDTFVRGLIFIVVIGLLIAAINYLSSILLPFFCAWFAAYLLYPVVKFFQYKLRLRSRILSIVLTLMLICGCIYGFCAITVPSIVSETEQFKKAAIEFIDNGAKNSSISPEIEKFINEQAEFFEWDKLLSQKNFIDLVKEAASKIWNVIYETAAIIITIISSLIALLYFFFILYDYEKLSKGIKSMVPNKQKAFFNTLFSDLEKGMNNYFRGQALIALSVGILFSIGFLIIDFPLAIPLGLFIGALSFVPYLHALGLVPAVIFSLFKAAETGDNFWIVLITCLAVFVVVQLIQDLLLTPKIMGDAVGLPPYLILLSLSIWGYVLGVIGMIIALPLTTLLISYYQRYVIGEQQESTSNDQKS